MVQSSTSGAILSVASGWFKDSRFQEASSDEWRTHTM